MNAQTNARVFNQTQREAEDLHRAHRLRIDWYTRLALLAYLETYAPPGITARELTAPFDYLDFVPTADFRWPNQVAK